MKQTKPSLWLVLWVERGCKRSAGPAQPLLQGPAALPAKPTCGRVGFVQESSAPGKTCSKAAVPVPAHVHPCVPNGKVHKLLREWLERNPIWSLLQGCLVSGCASSPPGQPGRRRGGDQPLNWQEVARRETATGALLSHLTISLWGVRGFGWGRVERKLSAVSASQQTTLSLDGHRLESG